MVLVESGQAGGYRHASFCLQEVISVLSFFSSDEVQEICKLELRKFSAERSSNQTSFDCKRASLALKNPESKMKERKGGGQV